MGGRQLKEEGERQLEEVFGRQLQELGGEVVGGSRWEVRRK